MSEGYAQCMIAECSLPPAKKNLCNRHYLQDYFTRIPRNRYRRKLKHEISALAGISYNQAEKTVKIIINAMTRELRNKGRVFVRGFGLLYYSPFYKKVYFTPHKELRWMVNHPKDTP